MNTVKSIWKKQSLKAGQGALCLPPYCCPILSKQICTAGGILRVVFRRRSYILDSQAPTFEKQKQSLGHK